MSRFTHALGKSITKEDGTVRQLRIDNKLVNLHRDGNITEEYLTRVNPKGQVCFFCYIFTERPLYSDLHAFVLTKA